MKDNIATSRTSRATCSIASLAVPCGVAAVEFIAALFIPKDAGALTPYVLGTYLLLAAVGAGAILAVTALVRRERWRILAGVAVLLNAVAAILLLVYWM